MRRPAGLILSAIAIALIATGCASVYERRKTASLTLTPLAPETSSEEAAPEPAKEIQIKTPMRIGLAFAPLPHKGAGARDIPSQLKQNLLEKVRNAFGGLSFIESIEVVPTTYLKDDKEWESLVAATQAFNLDAMALLTYDQEQFSDPSNWSFFYWTIVGLYLVPGDESETRTLLEASVVSVNPRMLLLHASGSDKSGGWSTPIHVSRNLREKSEKSFVRATDNLVADLRAQLDKAQASLEEGRGLYGTPVTFVAEQGVVTARSQEGSGGGGGDLGWTGTGLLVLMGLCCRRGKRRMTS